MEVLRKPSFYMRIYLALLSLCIWPTVTCDTGVLTLFLPLLSLLSFTQSCTGGKVGHDQGTTFFLEDLMQITAIFYYVSTEDFLLQKKLEAAGAPY